LYSEAVVSENFLTKIVEINCQSSYTVELLWLELEGAVKICSSYRIFFTFNVFLTSIYYTNITYKQTIKVNIIYVVTVYFKRMSKLSFDWINTRNWNKMVFNCTLIIKRSKKRGWHLHFLKWSSLFVSLLILTMTLQTLKMSVT
jgi:hypothetical protein